MKDKNLYKLFALGFLGILVIMAGIVFIGKNFVNKPTASNETNQSSNLNSKEIVLDTTLKPNRVVVYYFHGDFRCSNCLKIESYTKEAIQTNFPEEIQKGDLVFQIINVDKPDNEHFIKDYGLFTKSVVLSEIKDNKQVQWKNLDKIWTLLTNKTSYESYIVKETKLALDKK